MRDLTRPCTRRDFLTKSKLHRPLLGVVNKVPNSGETTTRFRSVHDHGSFSLSHLLYNVFALLLQLPPFRNSDQPFEPLGHLAGTPPPSPLRRCMPSFLHRGKSSGRSSLVDSRRIVRTHARCFLEPIFAREKRSPLEGSRTRQIGLSSCEVSLQLIDDKLAEPVCVISRSTVGLLTATHS